MSEAQSTAYDALAYPSRVWPQTHPDRLATNATLFGMSPTPVDKCRVLELGCGDGTNLIAMAFSLPGSTFLGVDLAPTVIAKAKAEAKDLGLTNVEFHCADLLKWSPPEGTFDYIIAHGFYSWVPAPVRERRCPCAASGSRRKAWLTSATTRCRAATFAACFAT